MERLVDRRLFLRNACVPDHNLLKELIECRFTLAITINRFPEFYFEGCCIPVALIFTSKFFREPSLNICVTRSINFFWPGFVFLIDEGVTISRNKLILCLGVCSLWLIEHFGKYRVTFYVFGLGELFDRLAVIVQVFCILYCLIVAIIFLIASFLSQFITISLLYCQFVNDSYGYNCSN